MTHHTSLFSNPRFHLLVLSCFACLFLFSGTSGVQLIDWDENIYAEAGRQMMVRGDYLNVTINNQLFSEKPPFFFWEQVIAYRLFGVNEFAARFPSGLAGVLMMLLLYHIGTKIGSSRFGLIWGLVYLTSLLPSVFGRAAVIDHTFNLFIAAGAYFLYLFDNEFKLYLTQQDQTGGKHTGKKLYLGYLTLASVSMGLACLTKGPLGGVIPLVAFGGYKIYRRSPRIRWAHFLYCGALSLSIALSWYLINWLKTGESFLEGFIRFQFLLFSQSLEGHQGPFFYHFLVALVGLLPWTPFLFAFSPRRVVAENDHFQALFFLGAAWTGFVLILFSIVSTKLPHYSASVYIPLSMFVAFVFTHMEKEKRRPPVWTILLFLVLGAGLGCLIVLMPELLNQYAEVQLTLHSFSRTGGVWITGIVIALLFITAAVFWAGNRFGRAVIITALAMTLFTQGLWRLHLPSFVAVHQQPLLELVHEVNKQEKQLVFYRMVSFAAFFYGRKPIVVLHNYKFSGNPDILDKRPEETFYIITGVEHKKRLVEEHPLAEFVRDSGKFSLFVVHARKTGGFE